MNIFLVSALKLGGASIPAVFDDASGWLPWCLLGRSASSQQPDQPAVCRCRQGEGRWNSSFHPP